MKKQQGFTLIELMIAVAIVGILAAVAIPQYQNYIARSQVSEAVTLLSGLKAPVIEHYSVAGEFPAVASLGSIITEGKYVASIVGTGGTAANGATYTAQFQQNGVNSQLSQKKLDLVFSSNGSVKCKAHAATAVDSVPAEFLPAACEG